MEDLLGSGEKSYVGFTLTLLLIISLFSEYRITHEAETINILKKYGLKESSGGDVTNIQIDYVVDEIIDPLVKTLYNSKMNPISLENYPFLKVQGS